MLQRIESENIVSGISKDGARLHVRLMLIFGAMAAVPVVLMALFSALFFHFGVQTWFSERVKTAVMESRAVAEAYLEEHQQVIKADLLAMAVDIDRDAGLLLQNPAAFERAMDTQSFLRGLSEAMIFDGSGRILARSGLTFTLTFENLPGYLLERARDGEVVVMTGADDAQDGESDGRVRAFVKLRNFGDAYLFVGRMVDPTVLSRLDATRDAADAYARLEGQYSGVRMAATAVFVVLSLLLLAAAVWLGTVLARQLVRPITALVAASDRVRGGDLSARVPETGQIQEFDYLARSFNRMTGQIAAQRDELMTANRQLDERRRFSEAILAGVSAGVIGVDINGRVVLANATAEDLFESGAGALNGRALVEIVPGASALLQQAQQKPGRVAQAEVPYIREDGARLILLVRIAMETTAGGAYQGAVLTFDDITELQAAQRKAAWADVARRIAHEIKNPLTPIQLSAERLKRKYLKEIQTDPQVFSACTDTIIRHVGDIGRMVNEFSAFARMPLPAIRREDLAASVRETLVLQREAHTDIVIRLAGLLSGREPVYVDCDVQQMRQAVTNLVQNAIDAIEGAGQINGEITVLLGQVPNSGDYVIAVGDNGPGLPEDAASLAEPYVTHREKGTGLGLAIVKKIMEDHRGRLVIGVPSWLGNVSGWEKCAGAVFCLVFSAVAENGDIVHEKAA